MKDARASRGAAPTFLPAAARRARPRLARDPRPGSVRTAGSGPGGDLGPGRQRRRTRQPAPSPVTAAWAAPSLTTFRLTPCPHRGSGNAADGKIGSESYPPLPLARPQLGKSELKQRQAADTARILGDQRDEPFLVSHLLGCRGLSDHLLQPLPSHRRNCVQPVVEPCADVRVLRQPRQEVGPHCAHKAQPASWSVLQGQQEVQKLCSRFGRADVGVKYLLELVRAEHDRTPRSRASCAPGPSSPSDRSRAVHRARPSNVGSTDGCSARRSARARASSGVLPGRKVSAIHPLLRSSAISPAITRDDLPTPEGPATTTSCCSSSIRHRSPTSVSLPTNSPASASAALNGNRPR